MSEMLLLPHAAAQMNRETCKGGIVLKDLELINALSPQPVRFDALLNASEIPILNMTSEQNEALHFISATNLCKIYIDMCLLKLRLKKIFKAV